MDINIQKWHPNDTVSAIDLISKWYILFYTGMMHKLYGKWNTTLENV